MKVNIEGREGSVALLIHFLLISLFCHPVVSQYPGFYWENENVVKPMPYRAGTKLKIAVIEGEIETIQCFVRTNRVGYKIYWDYKDFKANNTGTSIVGDDGEEHAVSKVTVNPDNPAEIDDKVVTCMKGNGEKIALQFKVYVNDRNVPCKQCNGTEEIKLRRWGNKKTEDEDLQKAFMENLKNMLMKKHNYAEDEVYLNGSYICGCKKKSTITKPTSPPIVPSQDSGPPSENTTLPSIIGISFGVLVLVLGIAFKQVPIFRKCWNDCFNCLGICPKKYNCLNEDAEMVQTHFGEDTHKRETEVKKKNNSPTEDVDPKYEDAVPKYEDVVDDMIVPKYEDVKMIQIVAQIEDIGNKEGNAGRERDEGKGVNLSTPIAY